MATVIPLSRRTRAGSERRLPPGFRPQPVWVPPEAGTIEVLASGAFGVGTAIVAPLIQAPVLRALGALVARPASSGRTARPPAGSGQAERGRADPDPGWFGPESVAWKVHADTSMFVAGMSAFALQALHPLALAGVADHSAFTDDFMGRIRRTGEFVSGVVYGSAADAERRCAAVRSIHDHVVGFAPDGRPYAAGAPDLLEWVHVGEYLAIAAAYRRFGLHRLDTTELDRYVGEVARVGEEMGVIDPPRTWSELDASYQRFRPSLAVGEQAVTAVRFLREPPGLPPAARAAWRIVWAGAVACLPPSARRLLGVPDPRPQELIACRSLVRGLGAVLGPPPPLAAARARVGRTS